LFFSIYRSPYWQHIFTHTTLYVRNLDGCKVDKYKDGRTDGRKRRASLSKKGEWQLNSGDRLKGTNVIDQQVDLKKYVFLYLSVNSCRRRFSTEDYQTHTQFLTCLCCLFKRQVLSKFMT